MQTAASTAAAAPGHSLLFHRFQHKIVGTRQLLQHQLYKTRRWCYQPALRTTHPGAVYQDNSRPHIVLTHNLLVERSSGTIGPAFTQQTVDPNPVACTHLSQVTCFFPE